ncbi:hypothetical protein V8F20_009097, partial [Naviculisporaceae sp. PSN 640]
IDLEDFCAKASAGRKSNGELSPPIRAAICALIGTGRSVQAVAKLFGTSRHAVMNAVERWNTAQTFESAPKPGRPEALTDAEKEHIIQNQHLTQRTLMEQVGGKVSKTTIKRVLRKHRKDSMRMQR